MRPLGLEGRVILSSPVSLSILTGVIASLFCAGAAIAAFANYPRQELVSGWLVPVQGVADVYARQAGVIEQVKVADGDIVAKGDVLAVVNLDTRLVDGRGVSTLALDSIDDEVSEVRRQLQAVTARHSQDEARLRESLEAQRKRLLQTQSGISLQKQKIDISSRRLEALKGLASDGYASKVTVQSAEQELIQAKQTLTQQESEEIALQDEISSLEAEIEGGATHETAETSPLKQRLAALERERAQTIPSGSYAIESPAAGRVTALSAKPGGAAATDRPLMAVLPTGGRLQAVLYAPSRAIGFIERDQEVRIRYAAYPYERYGTGQGRIVDVSSVPLQPSEVGIDLSVDEPVYRLTIALDYTAENVSRRPALQAGMLVSANVILEQRSLWDVIKDAVMRGVDA